MMESKQALHCSAFARASCHETSGFMGMRLADWRTRILMGLVAAAHHETGEQKPSCGTWEDKATGDVVARCQVAPRLA
jgi:hypothetical protein